MTKVLEVLEAKWTHSLDGEDGASVISAVLDGDGRLVFTLSNTESIRTAPVVGPKGDTGEKGETGQGRVTKVTKVRWVLVVCLWSTPS